MKSLFVQFLGLLFLALILSFGIHAGLATAFFKFPVPAFLLFSYKFNFGITLLFSASMLFFSTFLKDQTGFVFISGSVIKLILFMAISYLKSFTVDRSTAFDFLIPYCVCLFIEVFLAIKLLQDDRKS